MKPTTATEKLNSLSTQIDFILKLNADFEEFAIKQIEALHTQLDKQLSRNASNENLQQSIENIKQLLNGHLEEVKQDANDIADSVTQQREMISNARLLPDGAKKDELVKLVIEQADLPGGLEWQQFQQKVLELELERRKGFKDYVDDISQAIKEGDVIELEAFLEEQALEDAQARGCNEGDCQDDDCLNCENQDFDEEEVAALFKQLQKPYGEQPDKTDTTTASDDDA